MKMWIKTTTPPHTLATGRIIARHGSVFISASREFRREQCVHIIIMTSFIPALNKLHADKNS